MTQIGLIEGEVEFERFWSRATAINDDGVVVGSTFVQSQRSPFTLHAFIWKDGYTYDLDRLSQMARDEAAEAGMLSAGYEIRTPLDINNRGQVLTNSYPQAVLLSPPRIVASFKFFFK